MTVHQFTAQKPSGETISLADYKGKVLLIVNTASKCQYTFQFEQLQKLYETYRNEPFEILGFPCNQFDEQEPGTAEEAAEFCQVNYGVEFPILEKVAVNGREEIPLFHYLKTNAPFQGFDENDMKQMLLKKKIESLYPQWVVGDAIKWNFTKFLIDQDGNVIKRFEPFEEPLDFRHEIAALLKKAS